MRMLLKDLQPHTIYILQMRTRSGERFSDWSKLFELFTLKDENPPNPVTNLSGTMSEGNLSLFWEAPTHNDDGTPIKDLKDYRVTISPNPADPEWPVYEVFVETNRADFPKQLNVASFGRYRASLTITVEARDLVGNLSAPVTLQKIKARPNPITGLTWVNVKDGFSGAWTAPQVNTDGTPFDDPAGFEVKVIYAGTNVKTYSAAVPKFDYSFEQNKADFGGVGQTAKTPITIEVRARDSVGQLSDPVSLQAGNPVPLKVTGVVASQVSEGVRVVWNGPTAADDDLVAYEIWSASTALGAGTLYGRVSASQREYIHQTVAYGQDHYLYVTAVDIFDSRSPDSDRSGPIRPKSPFTVDTTPPAATTLTVTTPTRSGTDPAAITLTWPAVNDADLAGYHIRYSRNITPRSWEFYDVIDKSATTTTIQGLYSNTGYVAQIRSYDTMINPSAWSAEASGTSSTSTVPPMTEISSSISVISGGVLRSSNFDETAQTGWRLMSSGLDILSGSVNARVIKAGTMFSTQNVTHDGTTQPAWSLNLAGNMSINDAQVRGKIVVGNAAGTTNGSVNIASYNYGGSGSQWAIKGDGTIDLKAGGTGANSLQITNSGIRGFDSGGNERITLNTSGQFTLATTNGGVRFDDNGIYGYSGATNTFYINRSGAAYFAGQISASSGLIAGWNITSNNLYAGSLNLRSDLGMIYGGDGAGRVAMRAGEGFWAGADWSYSSPPFSVSTAGYLYSRSGQIGGFYLNGDYGFYGGDNSTRVQMQPGYGFWAGANSRDSSPFQVHQNGYLYASSANITGTINAQGGNFSGEVYGGSFVAGSFYSNYYGNTRVVIGPGQTDAYWSGFPGVRFDNGYGSYSGIAGNARQVQIFAAEYSNARIHLDADAGIGGQISLKTNGDTRLHITGDGAHIQGYNNLNFGTTTRQMINLYGTGYGIGIQSNTLYFRTENEFTWYRGGGHSDAQQDGGGGARNMRLDYYGGLYVQGPGYFNQSTRRGKKDIADLPQSKGLAAVKRIRPVEYVRADSEAPDNVLTGVIAEELVDIAPELVMLGQDGLPEAVNYGGLTTYLLKAVQELAAEVEALRAQLPPKK